jgi:transmembrane sensor
MDQLTNQQFFALIDRVDSGIATAEEIEFLNAYYQAFDCRNEITNSLSNDERELLKNEVFTDIEKATEQNKHIERVVKLPVFIRIAAAACILFAFGVVLYKFESGDKNTVIAQAPVHDVMPGGNKAILTLSNGSTITLNNARNGVLSNQAGTIVTKTSSGQLVYRAVNEDHTETAVYNTITTPKGGQYTAVLSDGTKFMLDAASSIRYPVRFGTRERKVEITGQVYFEVKHNAAHPFKVAVGAITVEDIGTRFNINAYSDEGAVKTTLLQGSVGIQLGKQNAVIKPGEVGAINCMFNFKDANIQTVMRQIARWYDVAVVCEGKIPGNVYSGELYRNMTAAKMLDGLTAAKVHYRIDGKKIIITP